MASEQGFYIICSGSKLVYPIFNLQVDHVDVDIQVSNNRQEIECVAAIGICKAIHAPGIPTKDVDIIAQAALQTIVPAVASELVVAIIANQNVVAIIASQSVREGAAGSIFDVADHGGSRGGASQQIDIHT